MDEEADDLQPTQMEVDFSPVDVKSSEEQADISPTEDSVKSIPLPASPGPASREPASPKSTECVKVNGDVSIPGSPVADAAQSEASLVSCSNHANDQQPVSSELEQDNPQAGLTPETQLILEEEDTLASNKEDESQVLQDDPPASANSPIVCHQDKDSVLSPQSDEVSEPHQESSLIQDVSETPVEDSRQSSRPNSSLEEPCSVSEAKTKPDDIETSPVGKDEDENDSVAQENTSNESSFEALSINTDSQHSNSNKDELLLSPNLENVPDEEADSKSTSDDLSQDHSQHSNDNKDELMLSPNLENVPDKEAVQSVSKSTSDDLAHNNSQAIGEVFAVETQQSTAVEDCKQSHEPEINEATSNSECNLLVDESVQNLSKDPTEETTLLPEVQPTDIIPDTIEDEVDAQQPGSTMSAKFTSESELQLADKDSEDSQASNKGDVHSEENCVTPDEEGAILPATEKSPDVSQEESRSPINEENEAMSENEIDAEINLAETNDGSDIENIPKVSQSEQSSKDAVHKCEDDQIEQAPKLDDSTNDAMDFSCASPVVEEDDPEESAVDEQTNKEVDNQSAAVSKSVKRVKKPKLQKNEQTEEIVMSEEAYESGGDTSPSLSRTEYAQYLGLQPTVKFKCCKCGDANFASISKLKEHQNLCLKSSRSNTPEVNNSLVSPLSQPQMRITRKVYLCSSCGTYFENWNLYIHMREVHRRYVCLTCLAMFVNAEKLALHMSSSHNTTLETFSTADDFLSAYPTSCFLTCCTCERVFSEQDNFYHHECGDRASSEKRGCAMCGLQFAHLQDCPHSTSSGKSKSTPSVNSSTPSASGSNKQQETNQQSTSKKPSNAESSSKPVQSAVGKKRKQKQVYIEPDGKLNASSVCEVGMNTLAAKKPAQTKLKPTCLRIKLGPLSKLKPKKSLPDISKSTDINISLDNDVSENPSVTENHKADSNDDSSTPLLNGEKSPSESIEMLTESNEEANESQAPDVSDIVMQSPTVVKSDESESDNSETHQEDSVNFPTESETNVNPVDSESLIKAEKEESGDVPQETQDKLEPEECAPVLSEDEDSPMEIDDSKDVDGDDDDGWHIDEQSPREDASNSVSPLPEAEPPMPEEEELQFAGEDAPVIELILEGNLEEMRIQSILKRAVQEACNYTHCVYCTHANKIAVNGKQLAVHLLSEHRYQLVVNSEKLSLNKFIDLVKEKMSDLEVSYFNCDTYDNFDRDAQCVFVKSYECFQCRYITKVHKDLYLHNRKMHQKNSLVCIMCKSNFYSYSELLCHLCPGIYMVTNQPLFRCCFCPVDNLPSAFRFMVHVRKVHQACDVCLEITGNQQKLSNHVWKHKLLHFCYRCGIAYRNKPDITKHLFWKHGTESVVCKRCLHKKWPYVYHFCIPPSSFTCEECNATFSKAVALKVHKRLHTNELLYPCEACSDSFISQKLLARHDRTVHNPPPPEEVPPEPEGPPSPQIDVIGRDQEEEEQEAEKTEDVIEKKEPEQIEKKKVDVYDLPPLNLSSESEDESDTEEKKKPEEKVTSAPLQLPEEPLLTNGVTEESSPRPEAPPQIVDSVWENFKDYKSSKPTEEPIPSMSTSTPQTSSVGVLESIRLDHDYFGFGGGGDEQEEEEEEEVDIESDKVPSKSPSAEVPEVVAEIPHIDDPNSSFDHNYCTNNSTDKVDEEVITPKKKQKSPKKRHKSGDSGSSSSDSDSSSSGSGSSSCSCGTNCSCSSSSSSSKSGSSSSDSSDSDSSCAEKKAARKARKKERSKARKHTEAEAPTVNGHGEVSTEEFNVEDVAGPPILLFHESDLDTNESETDEDFYDEHPRRLMPARNLLLLSAAADSLSASQPTPPPLEPTLNNGVALQEQPTVTKLSKSKKRKRSLSMPRNKPKINILSTLLSHEGVSPPIKKIKVAKPKVSLSFPSTPQYDYSPAEIKGGSGSDADKRLSKRKRVPKKFYGDSSDEEGSVFSAPSTPFTPIFMPLPPPVYVPPPPLPPKPQPKKKVKIETENVPARSPTEADMKLQAILDYVAAGYDGRTADDDNYKPRPNKNPPPKLQPKLIINISNHINRIKPDQDESSSSSEESEGDNDADQEEEEDDEPVVSAPSFPPIYLKPPSFPPRQESGSAKLYCYCHCPYDEVSEMIACDGKNCAIEWFHFECVGITVPPKGKWYCPDCRKRYNIAEPVPNPQYFYNPSSEYMMSSADPSQFET